MSEHYVALTFLRSELHAAREAIQMIYAAQIGILQGTLDGQDLDDAIYAAVELLPADMRSKTEFEDLLG